MVGDSQACRDGLWLRVYEANVQYHLAGESLSQWDHWHCHASPSIFWVEPQLFAQLHMKWFDTPTNCVWLLSSMKNPFLVICAPKTPRQTDPARCHSGGKKRVEGKIITKIWLTPKQRTVIVHCVFVFFNFKQFLITAHDICHEEASDGSEMKKKQHTWFYLWCKHN